MQDWLDEYLLSKPGASSDYKAEWEWQRYLLDGKMFAAICTPGPKHVAYYGHTLLQLKCEPDVAEILRRTYKDIVPGFYCDKRNWNSVYLDGEVPEDILRSLCDRSYRLVLNGFSKKRQREILGEEAEK